MNAHGGAVYRPDASPAGTGAAADRWLRNAVVEVLVGAQPRPRILAFRRRGGISPLRRRPDSVAEGVRTWFMEPGQIAASRGPGEQPAQIRLLGDGGLEVVAWSDPVSALQLTWRLHLAGDEPRLVLEHILTNRGEARRIALWAIVTVPARGTASAVQGASRPGKPSALVLWPGVACDHAALHLHGTVAGFNFGQAGPAAKLGVRTGDGEAWYEDGAMTLRSVVSRREAGDYPEGGGDVTFYHAGSEGAFGEIEHVGPLTLVETGGVAVMSHQLTLDSA